MWALWLLLRSEGDFVWVGSQACVSPRLMGVPQREDCSKDFWSVVTELSVWAV